MRIIPALLAAIGSAATVLTAGLAFGPAAPSGQPDRLVAVAAPYGYGYSPSPRPSRTRAAWSPSPSPSESSGIEETESPASLPKTGAPIGGTVAIGLAAVAVGGGALMLTARRVRGRRGV